MTLPAAGRRSPPRAPRRPQPHRGAARCCQAAAPRAATVGRRLLVAAALCAGRAGADLPVHCLRHQIAGEWDFHLGRPSAERSSCGHQSPDAQDRQPLITLSQVDEVKQVSLQPPNVARTRSSEGDWTMVYDEGFEVNVDGLSFFAFSRFDLKEVEGVRSNVSLCGETQLGWYHDLAAGLWGCYYARRRDGDGAAEAASPLSAPPPGQAPGGAPKDVPEYDEPLSLLYHSAIAAGLNLLQDVWTARAHDRLVGRSLREINGMAGIRRPFRTEERGGPRQGPRQGGEPPEASAESFLKLRPWAPRRRGGGPALGTDEAELPAAWDWRNVSGVGYLDVVVDQGDCGSCYAVSTIRMLSARHRIRRRDPTLEPFSVAFPLQCSEYTQGCDGGYAFLTSRWSQDVGLAPQRCAEYQGSKGSCRLDCPAGGLGRRWRADGHRYVGGYYGAASEAEMMRELVEGGPLVASFEPKVDFMYYDGGVYKTVPGQRAEWEQVDHAVLLVGYGEERGQKYWTLQNSWGGEWGEGGFFRMARGCDESGIESIVVAADVVEDTRPASLSAFLQQPAAAK